MILLVTDLMLQQTFVTKPLSTSFYYFNLTSGFDVLRKAEVVFSEGANYANV